ncbi:MAG: glycosyltransferase family 2 protein [Anaerobutyricum hallii]|uniref:glycosyltransferase family 2 protein n=1 Tax=Anaerobutyricum hallii TaxID=39488 RepID=UPI002A81AD93|nr:glycosyltransferase family 2 protein [Anaerobutyricum hallii]MDY4576591.1 glycosyltransferase family 2 protein [Anaerobutyricum hallii]
MNENITVIVPVYNVKDYLRQSLDSIIGQSYKNFKVIIVDDGSTDGCASICDEYAKSDMRMDVIHKNNGGLMSAWVCGLERVQTEFVVFVDSDDYIAPDMLQLFVEKQREHNADVVVGNYKRINTSNVVRAKSRNPAGYYAKDRIKKEIYPSMINTGKFQTRGLLLSRWGKLIRTELIRKNLKYCDFRISYGEDLNIMIPVFCDCNSISIIDDANSDYYYRMNNQSIVHIYKPTMYQQVELLYAKLYQAVSEKNVDGMNDQLQADYLAAIVQCFKNELSNPNGQRIIVNNIARMCENDKVKKAIAEVDWKHYELKNKVIIFTLSCRSFITRETLIGILRVLKKYY